MLALPIPIIVALLLLFLLVRFIRREGQIALWLVGLLAACALQSLIVALVQHYDVTILRLWQPFVAVLIPPLVWLAFLDGTIRPVDFRTDWMNVASPIAMLVCLLVWRDIIDLIVIVSFLFYGLLILVVLRQRAGDLPLAPLGAGHMPDWLWRMIALALIASAVSDLLILLAIVSGQVGLKNLILSLFSSAALLAIGVLGLSPDSHGKRDKPGSDNREGNQETDAASEPAEDLTERHQDIMTCLNGLIERDQLYLDPDLTLSRLSRRLGYPSKQVSMAVNQLCGENLSRFINGHRIRHACTLLEAGESVTAAMFASGFNTKSNFNREFARITGLSPSQWRRQQQQT